VDAQKFLERFGGEKFNLVSAGAAAIGRGGEGMTAEGRSFAVSFSG
jgi:hypothetical protein